MEGSWDTELSRGGEWTEPEGRSYNTLPKVPLHHLAFSQLICLFTTSLNCLRMWLSMQIADRKRWEPGLLHEQTHSLKKEHSFQRWSFQGVVVLGHLDAASDHGLMERMLTLRWSLVTPMGVCRHKDGVRQRIRSAGMEGETSRKGEGWVQRTLDSISLS